MRSKIQQLGRMLSHLESSAGKGRARPCSHLYGAYMATLREIHFAIRLRNIHHSEILELSVCNFAIDVVSCCVYTSRFNRFDFNS